MHFHTRLTWPWEVPFNEPGGPLLKKKNFSLYIARSRGHTRRSLTTSQAEGPVQALIVRFGGVARYAATPPPSPRATPLKTLVSRPTGPSPNYAFAACLGYWRGFGWGVGGFGVGWIEGKYT